MTSNFKLRVTWSQPEDLVAHYFAQARDENLDVSLEIKEWIEAGGDPTPPIGGVGTIQANDELRALGRKLCIRLDEKFQNNPEIDYLNFLKTLPEERFVGEPNFDNYHGAWLGRSIGCLLGKPVEKVQREGIRAILQSSGRWPLSMYFTADGVPKEILEKHPWNKQSADTCLVENINGMAEDDDLNYPLIALLTLETYGRDFTTDHIADQWLKLLPAGRVYTAERVVYKNLLDGIDPAVVGGYQNPFKEWIGAFIRTDLYGWINPGNPKKAALMAYRDAWLSHRRSGLYGAAMSAAMCSVAMVSKDIDEVIDAGLAVLPKESRILEVCTFARQLGRSEIEYEAALDSIYKRVKGIHWVHTINNAALGILALTYSKGDFSSAITHTVMGGWDTDSIGATVGSICGSMVGAEAIPKKWSIPIDNRLASSIPGCDQLLLTDLAQRTLRLI